MKLEDFRLAPSVPRLEVEGYYFEVRVLDCELCVLVDAVVVFCGFANSKSMMRMLRRNTEGFNAADCPRISGVQLIPPTYSVSRFETLAQLERQDISSRSGSLHRKSQN